MFCPKVKQGTGLLVKKIIVRHKLTAVIQLEGQYMAY